MNGRGGDRRATTGRFAGLATEDDTEHGSLFVLGYPLTIVRDDETAQFLEDGKHLQLAGASLVDRFDARLLLDCSSSRIKVKDRHLKLDKAEEQELDQERYRDLDPTRENELETGSLFLDLTIDGRLGDPGGDSAGAQLRHQSPSSGSRSSSSSSSSDSENSGSSDSESSNSSDDNSPALKRTHRRDAEEGGSTLPSPTRYAAFAYQYKDSEVAASREGLSEPRQGATGGSASGSSGGGAAAAQQRHTAAPSSPPLTGAAEVAVEEEPYKPLFAVPSNLTPHLPEKQRIHRLLVRTARFVAANGDQVEVLLRVRQANNPNFSFLLPAHRTFPYYRWVVESAPRELAPLNAAPRAAPGEGEAEGEDAGSDDGAGNADHTEAQPAAGAASSAKAHGEGGVSSPAEAGVEYGPHLPPQDALNGSSEQPLVQGCDTTRAASTPGDGEAAAEAGYMQSTGPPAHPHMLAASAATGHMAQAYGPMLPPPAYPPPLPPHHAHAHALYSAAVQHHYGTYVNAAVQPPPGATARPAAALGAAPPPDAADADAATSAQVLPPVTKSIIDKLVVYVAKNGIAFEAVVRKRERANPAFAFLLPWSPHHSYYRRRLEEAVGVEAVAAALGAGEGGQATAGSEGEAGSFGAATSPDAAAGGDTQTHQWGGASASTRGNLTAAGKEGTSASSGVGEQGPPAAACGVPEALPGALDVPAVGEGEGEEEEGDVGKSTTSTGGTAAHGGSQHAVQKQAQSTAGAGKAVIIRANPKLSTAVPRPPKPPPIATVLAAATAPPLDESPGATEDGGGVRPPQSASIAVEDVGRGGAPGDGKEGKGAESQDVTAPVHVDAAGSAAAPCGSKEPGDAAAEAAEGSEEPSATGAEDGQVIMVFEPLAESSSSGSDSSSSSEYSASDEEGGASSDSGRSGSDLSMGDGMRAARKRRRQDAGAVMNAVRPVSVPGTAAVANAGIMDPDAAAAAARLEARRQAARLLLAKAKAQQEVAAAAQRTRAIHHHRHFFLKAADEDDAAAAAAAVAAQHERIPVPATAVAAALAARGSTAGAAEVSTTAEADGRASTPPLAEPLGSAVAAAEVLALERLVARQKEQQARLQQKQQEREHGQERGKQQQEAKDVCGGVPDKSCGKATQPAALSTAAPSAASLHGSAAAGGLPGANAPLVPGLPAKAPVAAASTASSLLALQDLVVAAAATAAAHKAAFEAMLRDPSQVIRTDRAENAGRTTSLGAEPSARPHGVKSDQRRRRSGEAPPRDDTDHGNGRSRDDHSRHRLRKRSKHGSRSRSCSRSRSRSRQKPKSRSDARPRSLSPEVRKVAIKHSKDRHRHDHGDRRLRSRSRDREQPSRERGKGERDTHDRGRRSSSRRAITSHMSSDGSGTDSSRRRSADRRPERSRRRGETAAGRDKHRLRTMDREKRTGRVRGKTGDGHKGDTEMASSHRSKLAGASDSAGKVSEAPLVAAQPGGAPSISGAPEAGIDAGKPCGDLRTRLRQLLTGNAGLL